MIDNPIVVFTAVHGATDVTIRALEAVAAVCPAPFIHLIGDDFSPEAEANALRDWFRPGPFTSPLGHEAERILYHCQMLGATEPPNLGASLAYAWQFAFERQGEALWVVESDVIPRPGILEAFREAAVFGDRAGAVAQLYTEVGGNTIATFGGMEAEGEGRTWLGLEPGMTIGSWDQSGPPRMDELDWAHLACLWIPASTLCREDIRPDPTFRLWYCDHDLSRQIWKRGLAVIVTDRAVAEHTRGCASTGTLWPDGAERAAAEAAGYEQLERKWSR